MASHLKEVKLVSDAAILAFIEGSQEFLRDRRSDYGLLPYHFTY